MVIKEKFDIERLVDERVEAIEDLDCNDLAFVIKRFVNLQRYIDEMAGVKDIFELMTAAGLKDYRESLELEFNESKKMAQATVKMIDEMTLRDEEP